MRADPAWLDIGDGLVAGLVATKLTEYGQQALWALTPQRIKDQQLLSTQSAPYRFRRAAENEDGTAMGWRRVG